PSRRHSVRRPDRGSAHAHHLGRVRALPQGRLRGASASAGGAGGLVTAYWCELAWMGGPSAEPGVLVEVEDGRITGVTSGIPAPLSGAWRLDGLTLPGLANAHSHAFQRALRGPTQRGRRSL